MPDKDPLAKLIEDMSESLQREIHSVRDELREGFDRVETAAGLHGKMITSGTLAIGAWNRAFAKHDRAIKDLQARIRQLERRRRGNGAKS